MTRKYKRLGVLAKIETTYGTDSVPTGAANAILLSNVKFTPLAGDKVSRDIITPYFGDQGFVLAAVHTMVTFDVEMQGSGTAGTAPGYGVLLRACSMAETIVAATSVAYNPVSSGEESASLYMNLDGVNHVMLGVRGTVKMAMAVKTIPKFSFTMTGLLGPIADTALPALTLSGFKKPLVVSKVNTPTCTFFGVSAGTAGVEDFQVDLGNKIEMRALIGKESVERTDRNMSGNISMEGVSIATKDWTSLARAGTTGVLQLIHGTAAGFIVQLDAPAVQVDAPTYDNSQGILMNGLPFVLTPSAGDDEFVLTVK